MIEIISAKNETKFITPTGQKFVFNYSLPHDIIDLFAECIPSRSNDFEYNVTGFHIHDVPGLNDFLRYILTFENITPLRKFAAIYSYEYLVQEKTPSFFIDVYNNNYMKDILTRQIEPYRNFSTIMLYLSPFYFLQYLTVGQKRVLKESKETYKHILGLANYLNGNADTIQQGISQGFTPYTTRPSSFEYDVDFIYLCKKVDFDGNNPDLIQIDELQYISQKLDSYDGFYNLVRYADNKTLKIFMSWFLPKIEEANITYPIIHSFSLDLSFTRYSVNNDSSFPYYEVNDRVPYWLLFLLDHISDERKEELSDWGTSYKFCAHTDNVIWLAKNDEKFSDVPLSLLMELYMNNQE